jgi:hypothetical protein
VQATRRPLLLVVLGSIAVNAILGIYALLVPHFGGPQWKVLGTSACVTGAGILVFACLPALEQRRISYLPVAGIAGSVLGFFLLVVAIWADGLGDAVWRLMGSALVVGGVGALASLLSLARLAPRYRVVFTAAVGTACLLGLMIVGGIWGGASGWWYARVVGVLSVVLAALTISVPILHRASRGVAVAEAARENAVRFCPSCGTGVPAPTDGVAACSSCGARFSVGWLVGVGDGGPTA